MTLQTVFSGGRFEVVGSYSRGKRVGPFVFVAGTTAIDDTGQVYAPGDAYAQTIFILQKIEKVLQSMGAELRHVVRSTAFLSDMQGGVMDFVKAHGEIFKDINPTSTGVEAGLTRPGMMVEIQVDAIIHDADGKITGL
jgi:enamine deaminase RidA (YjgF/YER057c/UK114 family)